MITLARAPAPLADFPLYRMGWDSVLTNLPYGERFRKHRRLIQEAFSPQAILAFRPLQRMEACTLLLGLLESPDSFMGHVRRFAYFEETTGCSAWENADFPCFRSPQIFGGDDHENSIRTHSQLG